MEIEAQRTKQPWVEPKATEIEIRTTEWWRRWPPHKPPKPHGGKHLGCGDCLWDDPS